MSAAAMASSRAGSSSCRLLLPKRVEAASENPDPEKRLLLGASLLRLGLFCLVLAAVVVMVVVMVGADKEDANGALLLVLGRVTLFCLFVDGDRGGLEVDFAALAMNAALLLLAGVALSRLGLSGNRTDFL